MPITSTDLNRLRGERHTTWPALLWWPQTAWGTATIANVPGNYPTGTLTVSGQTALWSNQKAGNRYVIRDTNDNLISTGIVRKVPSGNTFYPTGFSSGDTGIPTRISNAVSAGDTITVYNDYPLWTLLSRIVDQVFFKQFDVAYTNEGINPSPIVRLGQWLYALLDDNETSATFTVSADVTTWNEKSVSSYAWSIPGFASATTPLNESSVGFTMPVGFGLVECTVTDSGGATETAVRPVWVANRRGDNNTPDSYARTFQIDRDDQTLQGRDFSVVFTETSGSYLQESDIYPSMAMMLVEAALYNGQALDTTEQPDRAVGMVTSVQQTATRRQTQLAIDLSSPFSVLEKIPMVSQAIIETAVPTNWTEVLTGLATPSFLVWYILKHHVPNFLKLFDFNVLPEVSPPRKRLYALNGSSVSQQLQEIASLLPANIGCASDGSLYLLRNPNLENNAFRTAMDEAATITERDIMAPLRYPVNYRLPLGQLTVYGFALDSDDEPIPLGSIAPGRAQAQGAGRTSSDNLLVTSQSDLNQRSGHLFALNNNPTPEVEVQMFRNWDVFDPAKQANTWWRLSIPTRFNPRGEAINWRSLLTRVRREWKSSSLGGVLKNVYATLQTETFGQPGETIPIDRGGAGGENLARYPDGITYKDAEQYVDFVQIGQLAFAWDDEDGLARTTDPGPSAKWEDIKGALTGIVNDFTLNPFSDYVTSGYAEGALDAWCITTNGTACTVWYTKNARGSDVVWTAVGSYTMNDATCLTSAQLVAGDTEGVAAAIWRDQVGTYAFWTTNTLDWSASATLVDEDASSDTGNDDAPVGLAVTGTTIYTSGRDSSGNYRLYTTTMASGSFALVNNQGDDEAGGVPVCPILFYEGEVYAGVETPGIIPSGGPTETVTYDFSNGTSGWTAGSGGFGGYTAGTFDGAYLTFDVFLGPDDAWSLDLSPISACFIHGVTFTAYKFSGLTGALSVQLVLSGSSVFDQGVPISGTSPPGSTQSSVPLSPKQADLLILHTAREIKVGSVTIEYSGGCRPGGVGESARKLFAVSSPAGAATWTDISPAASMGPAYANSLATDPVFPGRLIALTENAAADTFTIYESTDYGSTWVSRGSNILSSEGLAFTGTTTLRWGDGSVNYNTTGINDGTEDDWTKGWQQSIGTVGRFLGVEAIL